MLRAHERAFQALLPAVPRADQITIVGGGLFPRTALILRKLRPNASLTIVDASRDHLEVARPFLGDRVILREQFFDPRIDQAGDLIVIPLAFIGNRADVYSRAARANGPDSRLAVARAGHNRSTGLVAVVETAESGYALRGVCLLVVLLTARAVVVAGRSVTLSVWSPVAYLWQDMLVAALFVAVDARVRRPRLAWTIYGALVLYVALNVPVTRVLSTPLTSTILRAARGPLADAVLHYVTVVNLVGAGIASRRRSGLTEALEGTRHPDHACSSHGCAGRHRDRAVRDIARGH